MTHSPCFLFSPLVLPEVLQLLLRTEPSQSAYRASTHFPLQYVFSLLAHKAHWWGEYDRPSQSCQPGSSRYRPPSSICLRIFAPPPDTTLSSTGANDASRSRTGCVIAFQYTPQSPLVLLLRSQQTTALCDYPLKSEKIHTGS